jgi:hypothetical protein
VQHGKSEPARMAIAASTGWIRSPKRSLILSSQLRSALADTEGLHQLAPEDRRSQRAKVSRGLAT